MLSYSCLHSTAHTREEKAKHNAITSRQGSLVLGIRISEDKMGNAMCKGRRWAEKQHTVPSGAAHACRTSSHTPCEHQIMCGMAGCLQTSEAASRSTPVSSQTWSLLRTPCIRPCPPSPLTIQAGSDLAGMSSPGLYPLGHPTCCSQDQVNTVVLSSCRSPDGRGS